MSLRYDKLWKMMKDNKMNKTQLKQAASVSQYIMSKMKRNEPVPMEVMMKFCKIFHCDIGDLMEVVED